MCIRDRFSSDGFDLVADRVVGGGDASSVGQSTWELSCECVAGRVCVRARAGSALQLRRKRVKKIRLFRKKAL